MVILAHILGGPLVIGKIIHFLFNTVIKMAKKGVRTNDRHDYIMYKCGMGYIPSIMTHCQRKPKLVV